MNTQFISTLCVLTLWVVLATTKVMAAQPDKPASVISLTDLNKQLSQLQSEVSAAIGSLNTVKESWRSAAELNKAATQFGLAYDALQIQMDTVRSNAVTIRATVNTHYDAWQKELTTLQNANLRERAQERFAKSRRDFDRIITKASEAKAVAVPFVSDLRDITIYLGADLSEDAVKSLSNEIWKLGITANAVNGKIEAVKEQITRTTESLPQK